MKSARTPLIAIATILGLIAALGLFVLPRMQSHDAPCATHEFEGSRFTVCTYDARRQDMQLFSRASGGGYLRSFDALQRQLGADASRVRFAMNAGMFNDTGAPIGLYVEDGDEQKSISLTDGPGNFHLKPNGVFWQGQDGALHIEISEDYARAERQARWATQSGPLLLINGSLHPRIADDGTSRLVRNGVGLRDQHTAYFVISSGFVSFGRFARFFRDELHCRDALFLDGTVSSVWAPSVGRYDDNHDLGPMVVVLDRR
ncbi:MAG: phosphodiester glycosidase family protein [Hyphomonadaceae bacterium]|nr:phosphodiester glycosidase family protein [Hyphomonadaceae bacterium]